MDNATVGQRIKDVRLSLGLTQTEFGQMIAPTVTKSSVNNWEHDRYRPNKKRLKLIADLGHVSIGYLLTGNQETNMANIQTIMNKMNNPANYKDIWVERSDGKNITGKMEKTPTLPQEEILENMTGLTKMDKNISEFLSPEKLDDLNISESALINASIDIIKLSRADTSLYQLPTELFNILTNLGMAIQTSPNPNLLEYVKDDFNKLIQNLEK